MGVGALRSRFWLPGRPGRKLLCLNVSVFDLLFFCRQKINPQSTYFLSKIFTDRAFSFQTFKKFL